MSSLTGLFGMPKKQIPNKIKKKKIDHENKEHIKISLEMALPCTFLTHMNMI